LRRRSYEGTINLSDPAETIRSVDSLLDFAIGTLTQCKDAGASKRRDLLTAGGSAYFDRVVDKFTDANFGTGTRIVLRGAHI